VHECEVDHSVRRRCRSSKVLQIVQVAPLDLSADCRHYGSRVVGASKADDGMAGVEELGNNCRANVSRCSGYEDAHACCSFWRFFARLGSIRPESMTVTDIPRHVMTVTVNSR
jgi:hypothetical protein